MSSQQAPISTGALDLPPARGAARPWTLPVHDEERISRSGAVRVYLPLFMLALLAALYLNAIGNPFMVDDQELIALHPDIREPAGLGRLWLNDYFAGQTADRSLYRPLTILSLHLNAAANGYELDPRGFRLVNLGLLWLIGVAAARWMGRYVHPVAAWLAAALLVAHPVSVETINHIVGRAQLLSMLGMVGFLWVQRRVLERGAWRLWQAALALGLCALAVGSSEAGLALAPLALLQAWVGPVRRWKPLALRTGADAAAQPPGPDPSPAAARRLWLVSLLVLLVPLAAYLAARHVVVGWHLPPIPHEADLTSNPLRDLSLTQRLPAALHVAYTYTRHIFLFDTHYNHIPTTLATWDSGGAMLGLGIVAGAVLGLLLTAWRRHWLSLALLMGLAQYLLVGNLLVPGTAYVSNRLMMPFTLAVAMLLAEGMHRVGYGSTRRKAAALIPCLAAITCMAVVTVMANATRCNEVQMRRADLEARPDSPVAMFHLAQVLLDTRRDDLVVQAIDLLELARDRRPDSVQVRRALAHAYRERGQNERADRELEQARILEQDPDRKRRASR